MSLCPGGINDTGRPIIVSQSPVFRFYGHVENTLGAFLNTAVAALTSVQILRLAHVAPMQEIVFKNVVNASFPYT